MDRGIALGSIVNSSIEMIHGKPLMLDSAKNAASIFKRQAPFIPTPLPRQLPVVDRTASEIISWAATQQRRVASPMVAVGIAVGERHLRAHQHMLELLHHAGSEQYVSVPAAIVLRGMQVALVLSSIPAFKLQLLFVKPPLG